MSTFEELSSETAVLDAYTTELQEARRKARRERNAQVAMLYPHVRTFVLKEAEAIGVGESAAQALAKVPRTITLVTPDPADPSRDHLFIGQYPVSARDARWKPAFEELDFVTSDGVNALRGHFRLTHSRLHAYGVLDIGDESVSVEYRVPPQTYKMRVAEGAAYLAPQDVIKWDTTSTRWKDAKWSTESVLEFTYGVDGEEVIGDEDVFTFVAWFQDVATGLRWDPPALKYSGYLNRELLLNFSLSTGVRPPTGAGTALFPYSLQVKLSAFGYDFEGGMVVGAAPGTPGSTVYGCIGDSVNNIGGLYRLDGEGPARLVSVHGRTLYAGTTPAAHTEIDGNRLIWSELPAAAAAAAGIPTAGFFEFSPDGARIVGGSSGATGARVHPDEVQAVVTEGELAAVFRHARKVAAEPGHTLTDLLNMSQFGVEPPGKYYDEVQRDSMEDFYAILQNYMDPTLRKTFFNPNPPPLNAELVAIANTPGTKGTPPLPWYNALSVPYTATAVGKFSSDPFAATLNISRSEAWLSSTSAASDVMSAQGPLLYGRRYQMRHQNLAWFLADQKAPANQAKYDQNIDKKAAEWIKKAKEQNVGTPEQLAELEKQIRSLAEAAKTKKQYWAFALYTYALTPAYLNMLQTIMIGGQDVDGSEFSMRVQRTVALLNVLDTTSLFSQQYAQVLQMFQFARLLPQMVDKSVELPEFNFVVHQIIKKFIETYINGTDPKMKEAAEELRKHASQEVIGKLLSIMHTVAAVGYGMTNWGFIAANFESTAAKIFGSTLPTVVIRLAGIGAVSAIMMFFATGVADWNALSDTQKAFVVIGATNVLAVNAVPLLQWGFSLGEVFTQNRAYFSSFKTLFSPKLLTEAQRTATSGFRGWLLQTAGPKIPAGRVPFYQYFTARQAAAGLMQPLVPKGPKSFVRAIFGKNISRFMATRLAGAFAIVGIVLSAIDLAKSGEPMEQAVNALFLIAAALELVAVIGAWAFAGTAWAIGGMLVSTVFSIVAFVGFVALLAGVILLIIMMTRPQQSPVEKFAKEQAAAANLYMQYKAAIDSFQIFRPVGAPQLAGIALFPSSAQFPKGDKDHALTIGSGGTVKQGPFDGTGHTGFYIHVDYLGRAKIGAPILDPQGKPVLQALGTDDAGKIVSKDFAGDDPPIEPKLLWWADIQGDGTYEESEAKTKQLKSAPFKLRSVYWEDQKTPRYLATDGTTGWRLTARAEEATVITLEMIATKPAELKMNDVLWFTNAHDEQTGPALQVPGSSPRTWSINPALPEGVELDAEEGTVKMRTGADVPAAPPQTYQLTVSNVVGLASTSFALEIRQPPVELVFA